MMDVRRLEVLVAAVGEGSLAGAARSLGITPSAASQAIGALESTLGRPLLTRLGRGVRPTEAGQRLAVRAQSILTELQSAEDEALGQQEAGLVLAAPPTVVAGIVPGVFTRLRATHPQLHLGVVEAERARAAELVAVGKATVAVVDHHATAEPDRGGPLVAQVIGDEPVFAWLPVDHRLAAASTVDLADLRGADWVASPPLSACFDLLTRACSAAGFAPRVVATCSEYRSAAELVAAGMGVSIAPRLALGAGAGVAVVAVGISPPVTRRLTLLLRPGPPAPATRTLAREVRAVAASTLVGPAEEPDRC